MHNRPELAVMRGKRTRRSPGAKCQVSRERGQEGAYDCTGAYDGTVISGLKRTVRRERIGPTDPGAKCQLLRNRGQEGASQGIGLLHSAQIPDPHKRLRRRHHLGLEAGSMVVKAWTPTDPGAKCQLLRERGQEGANDLHKCLRRHDHLGLRAGHA